MNKPRFALFALVCLLAILCLPGGALAAADTDFVSKLVSSFYDKTSAWEPILKKYALLVFRWLLILEVCFLGIKAALKWGIYSSISLCFCSWRAFFWP